MDSETRPETGRILIVDDQARVRELLTSILESDGHSVVSAGSAEEALVALRKQRSDLVLLDIDMPGTGGLELLPLLKGSVPDVEVVMVSGLLEAGSVISAIRRGACDYVTKPFQIGEIRHCTRRALSRRRYLLERRASRAELMSLVNEQTREILAKTEELESANRDLSRIYETTLEALMTALDFRDHETHGHSRRVVGYSVLIGEQLRVDEPQLTWIRWGAILHDIGKIGLPDSILRKPDRLTPAEWTEMQRHPRLGYQMLRHIDFLRPALEIVLHHHERWDGSGYPDGLRGTEIPLGARIFAVVDTFDAITSDRPYRDARTIGVARDEIQACSGTQFDPSVVRAFLGLTDRTLRRVRAQGRAGGEAAEGGNSEGGGAATGPVPARPPEGSALRGREAV